MNLKQTNIFTLLVLAIALTSGCDPMTGLVRTVRVQQLPSSALVGAALRDVPEVKSIEFHQEPERKAFSILEGRIREPSYYWFDYSTKNDGGAIEVRRTKKGENILELRRIGIGYTPRGIIDQNRALMHEIYASLRKQSPDLPPWTNMVEKLIRVRDK